MEWKKKQSETKKKHFDFGVIHFAMLVRILLCKMIVCRGVSKYVFNFVANGVATTREL